MRWQSFGVNNDEGMKPDLSCFSLEELYCYEKLIENRLDTLRQEEPAPKRKNEPEYRIWYSRCHGWLADLKEVRDAIAKKESVE